MTMNMRTRVRRLELDVDNLLTDHMDLTAASRRNGMEIHHGQEAVTEYAKEIQQLRRQMACGVLGHAFVFNRRDLGPHDWFADRPALFVFRCTKCGLEVRKTADDLTSVERSALEELGLIAPVQKEGGTK